MDDWQAEAGKEPRYRFGEFVALRPIRVQEDNPPTAITRFMVERLSGLQRIRSIVDARKINILYTRILDAQDEPEAIGSTQMVLPLTRPEITSLRPGLLSQSKLHSNSLAGIVL